MLNISQKAKNALLAPSRYIKFKIEVYFDGEDNAPTDITEDVISFDTVEEVSPSSSLPFGGVSYNELSVVLDNMSKLYTISNTSSMYNGKLIANKKVKLTYLVETDEDVFEEITGGVFYTDAWSSDNEALTATLTCYDKLALYGNKPVNRFKVLRNISCKKAFEALFINAGVPSTDYNISTSLNGTLSYFWCTGSTLNECLDDLTLLAMANVYVDKSNKIIVEPMYSHNSSDTIVSDSTLILSSKCNPSYDNVYSGINISYNVEDLQQDVMLCELTDITLEIGTNVISNILFSSSPVLHVSSIYLTSSNGVYVSNYTSTDNSLSIEIVNNNDEPVTATILVNGTVLSCIQSNSYISKQSETNNVLSVSLPLVCTGSYAKSYADTILDVFSKYVSTVTMEIRSFPSIELSDILQVDSSTSSINSNMYVTKLNTSFNDGIYSEITMRVL